MNPKNPHFFKMLVWKPVTLKTVRRAATDVYLNRSLKGFKQDIITTATTPVLATQLPLVRNPLARVCIKRGGRRIGEAVAVEIKE